jgi:XTP/dITP diphosphohydrolase
MDLLIATRNPGKIAEFRQMFEGLRAGFLSLRGLEERDGDFEPPETGRTFRANACLKASAYARHARSWALADDSGLAVDALGGAPGVYSARFAEMNAAGRGDLANNTCLLDRLKDVPDEQRSARFVCVLALADPQGRVLYTTEGSVEGRVLREPCGDNGFGYDPLFLLPSLGRTTAQLPPEQKHAISHRGAALRRMRGLIERWGMHPGR